MLCDGLIEREKFCALKFWFFGIFAQIRKKRKVVAKNEKAVGFIPYMLPFRQYIQPALL